MRYKKIKKEKVRTNITLDKDLYEESGLYIENLSGYLNECLKRGIAEAKRKEREEQEAEELRMINIKSTINMTEKQRQEALEIASFNWVDM